jgi:hypothetical protein
LDSDGTPLTGLTLDGVAGNHAFDFGAAGSLTMAQSGNDGAFGPIAYFGYNSATPADGDVLGSFQFFGKNDAAGDIIYGRMEATAVDVNDGTGEDGSFNFYVPLAGSDVNPLTITGAGLSLLSGGVINWDSGDVTITHAANDLAFAGVTGDYSFDDTVGVTGAVTASTDVTATAGDVTSGDDVISGDDVLLSDAGVVNFGAGDCTLTDGTNMLTMDGCDLTTEVVIPDGDNTRNLGSTAASWAVAHLTSIELGADSDTSIARSAAGEATLETDAIKHAGKQMMWFGAAAFRNSALAPASCGDTYDSGTQDVTIPVCAFDTGATEENAEFGFNMPKGWNEGTITMEFVWTNAGGASTETIQLKIACTGFGNDDALNTAYPADVTVADTWLAQNDLHVTAETSAITVQNAAENDYVTCRLGRDTSVDNMAGDLLVIGAKVYWTDNASTLAE